MLPGSVIRKMSEEEMAVYRAPFPTPRSRVPAWRLPNELPIAGKPADVYAMLEKAHLALRASGYPTSARISPASSTADSVVNAVTLTSHRQCGAPNGGLNGR